LPFQATVANYFVGRQIGMTLGDLARALLKSGLVTVCSTLGATVGMLNPHGFTGPVLELLLSGVGAAIEWVAVSSPPSALSSTNSDLCLAVFA
jgi:hypothetical protein